MNVKNGFNWLASLIKVPMLNQSRYSEANMEQMNIPEQTEFVHYINLTDLELFHSKKGRCSINVSIESVSAVIGTRIVT